MDPKLDRRIVRTADVLLWVVPLACLAVGGPAWAVAAWVVALLVQLTLADRATRRALQAAREAQDERDLPRARVHLERARGFQSRPGQGRVSIDLYLAEMGLAQGRYDDDFEEQLRDLVARADHEAVGAPTLRMNSLGLLGRFYLMRSKRAGETQGAPYTDRATLGRALAEQVRQALGGALEMEIDPRVDPEVGWLMRYFQDLLLAERYLRRAAVASHEAGEEGRTFRLGIAGGLLAVAQAKTGRYDEALSEAAALEQAVEGGEIPDTGQVVYALQARVIAHRGRGAEAAARKAEADLAASRRASRASPASSPTASRTSSAPCWPWPRRARARGTTGRAEPGPGRGPHRGR
jgi:hypothetical protein